MDLPLSNPHYVVIPIVATTEMIRQDFHSPRITFSLEPYPLAVIQDGDITSLQALTTIMQPMGLTLDRPIPYFPPGSQLMVHPHLGGFRIANPHWMLALSPHWYVGISPMPDSTYVAIKPYFNDTVPPGSIIWTKDGA